MQEKYNNKITKIRSDHSIEFGNAKFNQFCNKHRINHNILAPKTPLQNSIIGRKNKTSLEIARIMLIDVGITQNF